MLALREYQPHDDLRRIDWVWLPDRHRLNRKVGYLVGISSGFRIRACSVQAIKETIVHLTRTGRLLTAATATALAFTAFSVAPAFADGGDDSRGGHSVVGVHLNGSQPAPASPVIAGINPGGAPWVNDRSTARVREDGRIRVTIRGLVIPPPRLASAPEPNRLLHICSTSASA